MDLYIKNEPVNMFEKLAVIQALSDNAKDIKALNEVVNKLLEYIQHQQEHISKLYRIIYELAPEYEIIETMAETDEERQQMTNTYMNHNDDYYI